MGLSIEAINQDESGDHSNERISNRIQLNNNFISFSQYFRYYLEESRLAVKGNKNKPWDTIKPRGKKCAAQNWDGQKLAGWLQVN